MFCGLTLVTDSLYEVSPARPALVILPSPQHCSTPHGRTRLKLREVDLKIHLQWDSILDFHDKILQQSLLRNKVWLLIKHGISLYAIFIILNFIINFYVKA